MSARSIAPIAQRIEQIPPKDEIQVRFLVGAPSEIPFGTFDKSHHLVQNGTLSPHMESRRILRINDLLREHLGDIISKDVSLKPGVLATISKVRTAPDLRSAHVSVSVFPETESVYAMKTLGHESRHIEHVLHGRLHMKPLPRISFSYDPTSIRADEIEKILKSLELENKAGE